MNGHHGFTPAAGPREARGLWGHGELLGHGPHTGAQFPGDGHHHPMHVCAAGAPLSIACAPPHLPLPTEILDGLGQLFQTPLEVTADVGRIPVGPSAFDQGAARVGVAGLGERSLAAMVSRGGLQGREAEITPQLAGRIEPREVPPFCHDGDRDGALDAAEGLERVDHGMQAPGVHLILELLRKPSKTFAVFRHRPDVCWEDDWLRWRGTDDLTEPAPGGPGSRWPAL